jgi:hypothetical protein
VAPRGLAHRPGPRRHRVPRQPGRPGLGRGVTDTARAVPARAVPARAVPDTAGAVPAPARAVPDTARAVTGTGATRTVRGVIASARLAADPAAGRRADRPVIGGEGRH